MAVGEVRDRPPAGIGFFVDGGEARRLERADAAEDLLRSVRCRGRGRRRLHQACTRRSLGHSLCLARSVALRATELDVLFPCHAR
jgi:hypothetical protein